MKKLTFAIIALLGMGFGASAQTQTITVNVPSVSMIAFQGGSQTGPAVATLELTAPTAGNEGSAIGSVSKTGGNLVFSTINEATNGFARQIDVKVSSTVPGIVLSVGAVLQSGSVGDVGVAASVSELSTTDQPLVTSINSGYTGTTTASGAELTYTAAPSTDSAKYEMLVAGTKPAITVTYTLKTSI